MRLRFFLIILAVLVSATAGVTYVHLHFFRMERLRLIDTHLKKSASILLSSELADLKKIDLDEADDILTDELGEDGFGKIFIIRNDSGEILYASRNAAFLNREFPGEPQWVTSQTKEHFIRVLNVRIPRRNRTLQVGIILDPNFLSWNIINSRVLAYIGLILAVVFTLSAGVTLVLLTPVRRLAGHLEAEMAGLQSGGPRLRLLPSRLLSRSRGFWARSDEFARLLRTTQEFLRRINVQQELARGWTNQMAHELKTPLTLCRTELESAQKGGRIDAGTAAVLTEEVDHIGHIINQFLEWADLENSMSPGNLHAVRIAGSVRESRERLERLFPGRVVVRVESEGVAIANPLHVDLMITNLVTNSLKFSPPGSPVEILVRDDLLRVSDRGPGIPSRVLERLGQPFNKGENASRGFAKGSGLGLAWVSTMARLYRWNLEITSSVSGTAVSILFPRADCDRA